MKKGKPVLSIYIATYNRKNIILKNLNNLLSIESRAFDVWVLDDCSDDGTVEALKEIKDDRLNVLKNAKRQGSLENGAMPNWFILAEKCDGIFSMHLNDRDHLNVDGVRRLINYLNNNRNLKGGICNLRRGAKIYGPEQAFLKLPYEASHPTGIIFNTAAFHKIPDREKLYTKEEAYIHPHDLVLGKLCEMGKMFAFEKIWSLAEQRSFKENKSFLYKKGNNTTSWFSPTERLKEYNLFLRAIMKAKFPVDIKIKKVWRMSLHYLFYCTLNYAYFISDPGQTAHYGIIPQKITYSQLKIEKDKFILDSTHLQTQVGIYINPIKYKIILNIFFLIAYLFYSILKK